MASLGGSADGPKPDAAWVANEFVKRYYEVLAKHPKYLNRFYKDESQFTLTIRNHGIPELRQTVSTTKAIQEKVNCTVQGAKITIEHSEAQYSLQSGVLLQVDGRLVLPNEAFERRYTQIFFLAPQDKGFFVLNDILCLHPPTAVVAAAAPAAVPAAAAVAAKPPGENGFLARVVAADMVQQQPQQPQPQQQQPAPAPPAAPSGAPSAPLTPAASAAAPQQQLPQQLPQQQPAAAVAVPQQPPAAGGAVQEAAAQRPVPEPAPAAAAAAVPASVAPEAQTASAAAAAAPAAPAAAAPAAAAPAAAADAGRSAAPAPTAAAAAEPAPQQQQQPVPQQKQQQPVPQQQQQPAPAAPAEAAPTSRQALSYAERLKLGRAAAAQGTAGSVARPSPVYTSVPGSISGSSAAAAAAAAAASSAPPPAAAAAQGAAADRQAVGASSVSPEPSTAPAAASSGGGDAAAAGAPVGAAGPRETGTSLMGSEGEACGIFLRGISRETTREQLAATFESFGAISNILIVPSRAFDTNTAYVDFEQEASAQKALTQYSKRSLVLNGVPVVVLPKVPKVQRVSSGFSSHGRRGGGRGGGGDFRRSGSSRGFDCRQGGGVGPSANGGGGNA